MAQVCVGLADGASHMGWPGNFLLQEKSANCRGSMSLLPGKFATGSCKQQTLNLVAFGRGLMMCDNPLISSRKAKKKAERNARPKSNREVETQEKQSRL